MIPGIHHVLLFFCFKKEKTLTYSWRVHRYVRTHSDIWRTRHRLRLFKNCFFFFHILFFSKVFTFSTSKNEMTPRKFQPRSCQFVLIACQIISWKMSKGSGRRHVRYYIWHDRMTRIERYVPRPRSNRVRSHNVTSNAATFSSHKRKTFNYANI